MIEILKLVKRVYLPSYRTVATPQQTQQTPIGPVPPQQMQQYPTTPAQQQQQQQTPGDARKTFD